jgi:hypothetical protein
MGRLTTSIEHGRLFTVIFDYESDDLEAVVDKKDGLSSSRHHDRITTGLLTTNQR